PRVDHHPHRDAAGGGSLDGVDDPAVGDDVELEVEPGPGALDELHHQRADVGARQGGGDQHPVVVGGGRDGCLAAAGHQVAVEDAVQVGGGGTPEHGVDVMVAVGLGPPVDATNDRNRPVDDEQLDVVDHEPAHGVVQDVHTLAAQLGGGGATDVDRGIDDEGDRHAAAVRGDQGAGDVGSAELVHLGVDAAGGVRDERQDHRECRAAAGQHPHGVAADLHGRA